MADSPGPFSGNGEAVDGKLLFKLGLTPEEIADEMDLELAGVYAALAYYHLNRDEIEADILANSEEVLMKGPGGLAAPRFRLGCS